MKNAGKKRVRGKKIAGGVTLAGVCGAGAGAALLSEWLFHFAIARKSWQLPQFFMKRFGEDGSPDPYKEIQDQKETDMLAEPCEHVEIRSNDGLKLVGRFYQGREDSREVFLAVHGFRCRGTREFCDIRSYYQKRGASYLVIDQRACGDSEGEYMTYGAKESEDVVLWANWLVEHCGADCRIFLHGVSLGSATVLITASKELPPQVVGVIADCGYTSAWEEFRHQMDHLAKGHGKWLVHATNQISRKRADFDFRDASPIEAVKKGDLPHLFIHGDADDFVPYRMEQELYDACTAPKRMITIEGAEHARSYPVDTGCYEEAMDAFIADVEA